MRFLHVGPRLRSTLPSHSRSPFCSCASITMVGFRVESHLQAILHAGHTTQEPLTICQRLVSDGISNTGMTVMFDCLIVFVINEFSRGGWTIQYLTRIHACSRVGTSRPLTLLALISKVEVSSPFQYLLRAADRNTSHLTTHVHRT